MTAEYLEEAEVARRYNVDPDTLWVWITDRTVRFPQPRMVDGQELWHESDLHLYEAHKYIHEIYQEVDDIHRAVESLLNKLSM